MVGNACQKPHLIHWDIISNGFRTMSEFQNLFKSVVAAIVNNTNTEGYTFSQIMKDVCGKKGLLQRIKGIFSKHLLKKKEA